MKIQNYRENLKSFSSVKFVDFSECKDSEGEKILSHWKCLRQMRERPHVCFRVSLHDGAIKVIQVRTSATALTLARSSICA